MSLPSGKHTQKNQHGDSLFLWPCSIANCYIVKLPKSCRFVVQAANITDGPPAMKQQDWVSLDRCSSKDFTSQFSRNSGSCSNLAIVMYDGLPCSKLVKTHIIDVENPTVWKSFSDAFPMGVPISFPHFW